MIKVNIHEAKANLSKYLERLRSGRHEVILLCKRNVPIAEIRLVPKAPTRPRPIGTVTTPFSVPDSFFEPLPDDILAAFKGDGG